MFDLCMSDLKTLKTEATKRAFLAEDKASFLRRGGGSEHEVEHYEEEAVEWHNTAQMYNKEIMGRLTSSRRG